MLRPRSCVLGPFSVYYIRGMCVFSCQVVSSFFAAPCTVVPPGSSVHGISQAYFLCWSGWPHLPPGDLDPGIKPASPALAADSLPQKPVTRHSVLIHLTSGAVNFGHLLKLVSASFLHYRSPPTLMLCSLQASY